jgi:hypothetical protein
MAAVAVVSLLSSYFLSRLAPPFLTVFCSKCTVPFFNYQIVTFSCCFGSSFGSGTHDMVSYMAVQIYSSSYNSIKERHGTFIFLYY